MAAALLLGGCSTFAASPRVQGVEVLAVTNNLAEVPNVFAARMNLGLYDVATIADLRALNTARHKTNVYVGGYFTLDDGGGGEFYWSPTSTASTNRGLVFKNGAESATGRWIRVRDDSRMQVTWFGAIPDDGVDDTLAIRAAIPSAITYKTSLYAAAGIFDISPQAESYIFSAHEVPAGSINFNNLLFEGAGCAHRLSRLDTDPDQTYSRGTVFKVSGNMANKICFQNGASTMNVQYKNFSIVGTGWNVAGSIGIRHSALSSHFEAYNVSVQHMELGYDVAGNWPTDGKANGDFVAFHRISTKDCGIGIKCTSWASYPFTVHNVALEARIPLWIYDTTTTSPKVTVTGSFIAPLAEFGGVVITGLVTAATSSTFTVGSLQKFTQYRDVNSFHLINVSSNAATAADVEIGMFAYAEKNCIPTGAGRVPTWGVENVVTAVNTGTSTLTVSGNVDTTELVGTPIYIIKPAIAFLGENFDIHGNVIERRQVDDKGFGFKLFHANGWGSTWSFRNNVINDFSEGSGANAIMPTIYHNPTVTHHAFPLSIEDNVINMLYAKFEVSGSYGVRFKNNKFWTLPLIIDHNGTVAEGVIREGDSHILKTRFPFAFLDQTTEARALVAQMGPDRYQQIGGLMKRPLRTVTAAPTSGTSGEIAITEGTPGTIYTIGAVSGISGYYDASAITAGTAAITSGSTVATVTNITGLFIGRVITIAGAGAGGADLTTRIVDIEIRHNDGAKRLHLFHTAGTTVTAGTIAAVAPVVESALTIGRANSTTSQLKVKGGSEGNDIFELERTDGATQNFSIRLGSGTAIFRDKTGSRNWMTLSSETAAVAARFDAGLTLTAAGTPGTPSAGQMHLYSVSDSLRVLSPALGAHTLYGVLSSDTPSNGQVAKWNTGGNVTWENDLGTVFSTGLGLTNVSGVLSNNIVAGANVTITAGADGQLTIAATPGGGGGSGDVVGPASSVASEVALFDGTTGKLLKRATGTGIPKLTAGVQSIAVEGTDYLGPARISNSGYGAGWDGANATAPSQNALFDLLHLGDTDDDGLVDKVDLGSAGFMKTTAGGVISSVASIDLSTSDVTGTLDVARLPASAKARGIELRLRGSELANGTAAVGYVKTGFTITEATLTANASCSIVIGVQVDTYPTLPDSSDNICGSAKPTLSSASASKDTTLTGWTPAIPSNSRVRLVVESLTAGSATEVVLNLEGE